MKKFTLLLLVLTGWVCMANAENVKKRIFIQNSGNWDNPALYMYKTSDGTEILGGWPGTTLNGYNSHYENWYFIDVTLEEETDYTLILNNNNNGVQSVNMAFNSGTNKFFRVWGTSNSDYDSNDLKYYLYNTNGSTAEMDLSDDLVLSKTIDNSAGNTNYYCIAPSFVTSYYASDDKRWSLMIRPYSDYQTLQFSYITVDQEYAKIIAEGGSNAWNTNGIEAFFDLTVNLGDWTYSVSPYIERTITNDYATFSSKGKASIPEGLTAYYATDCSVGNVKMESISGAIPANTGVFLKAAENKKYTFVPSNNDVTAPATNMLVAGTADGVEASSSSTNTYNYVFALQGGKVGFFNVGTDISTDMRGKAYLQTDTDIQPSSGARVSIIFDEEATTGINTVHGEGLTINGYFNLAGQRVAQPTKGLYIVNGKKVIMK